MKNIILPSCFFGDISYWIFYAHNQKAGISDCETYQKQSPRNHTYILGPNGKQKLTVPVSGQKGIETPIADIRIHRSEDYIKSHLHSIATAYGAAPFFESFFPLIGAIYEQDHERLIDFNCSLFNMLSTILKTAPLTIIQDPETFVPPTLDKVMAPYTQVFSYKFGFVPDLGIIDLIFNEGPQAGNYLEQHYAPD